MLHFDAMFFADGAAALASLDAGVELRTRKFEVGAGEARDDARGGQADVGAINVIANALHQLRHVLLAQAGIGTGVARFSASVAGRDALDVNGVIR